jgi:hypothetical protein
MRYPALALVIIASASILVTVGCKEATIGQPCQFDYIKSYSEDPAPCTDLPQCHPLLASPSGGVPGPACPLDCIQTNSIQCEDLICVATEVPDNYQEMNGQCTFVDYPTDTQCPVRLSGGCMGYCTRECETDKDCPKNYTCNPTAPYEGSLPCDTGQENLWADDCTSGCIKSSHLVDAPGTTCDPTADKCCPSASEKDKCTMDNGKPNPEYTGCCYCICSRFCPFIKQKVCRKNTYDAKMFPNGTLSEDAFNNTLKKCLPSQ